MKNGTGKQRRGREPFVLSGSIEFTSRAAAEEWIARAGGGEGGYVVTPVTRTFCVVKRAEATRRPAQCQKSAKPEERIEETRRKVKYPGISRDAEELGCSRVHLWLVLTGRRKSRALMARYRAGRATVLSGVNAAAGTGSEGGK